MSLVDSHAHLDSSEYSEDLAAVLKRAFAAEVSRILSIGCLSAKRGPDSLLQLLDQFDHLYGAFGVHPHDATSFGDALENQLADLLEHPRVVSVGEIGLDYFYDFSPRDAQVEAFLRQLNLAKQKDLPVVVHTRDAEDETAEVMKDQYPSGEDSGVLHCFTGSESLAEVAMQTGFCLGFGGVLTFRRSESLRRIAAATPSERLLVETDCPYLAPEPNRGKRNEPSYLTAVVDRLAAIRGATYDEMCSVTSSNFSRLFGVDLSDDSESKRLPLEEKRPSG